MKFIKIFFEKYCLWKVGIVLILPLVFTWFLFKPLNVIELPTDSQHIVITRAKTTSNFIRTIFASTIETSLNLGFYNLCVKNEGFLRVNGQPVTQEHIDSSESEVGIAKIDINDQKSTI